ncbi:MAG: histidine kinase dimerization/phospho-acceptor domain-containing protein [Odoribacter splanchnicus]
MILTVTHDIKSPLSSVIGYIELLNNTPINERQRYFLKNMRGSSEHILKLIGNLLDLSKPKTIKCPSSISCSIRIIYSRNYGQFYATGSSQTFGIKSPFQRRSR